MNKSEKRSKTERRYPPFWEKSVPIVLGIIVVIIVVLVLVTVAVALGLVPGSG